MTPPTCHISELPDELLSAILRCATYISWEIEPQRLFSLYRPSSSERRRFQEYQENMLFKHASIKLVSKRWYSVSVPFQLEWVAISADDEGDLAKFLSSIRNEFGFKRSEGSHPSNWYTKRLDVVLLHDPSPELITALVDVITLLPNIDIFTSTIVKAYAKATDLYRSLYALPKDIRTLSCEGHLIRAQEWEHFLNNHPNLITINPPMIYDPDRLSLAYSSKCLEHILLYPSFTSARWLSNSCPTMNMLTIQRFFQPWLNAVSEAIPYASTLTRIHFACDYLCHIDFIEEYDKLFSQCVNLERLDLSVGNWYRLRKLDSPSFPSFVLPLSVKVLGIRIGVDERGNYRRNKSSLTIDDHISWFMRWMTHATRSDLSMEEEDEEGEGTCYSGKNQLFKELVTVEFFDEFTLDPFLAAGVAIVQYRPRFLTSWTMFDGTRIDLARLELQEVFELQERAKMRIKIRGSYLL